MIGDISHIVIASDLSAEARRAKAEAKQFTSPLAGRWILDAPATDQERVREDAARKPVTCGSARITTRDQVKRDLLSTKVEVGQPQAANRESKEAA